MSIFQGLSAFPITPANEDGAVLTDDLSHILQRLVAADVHSIGLLGSTGTYAYLSRAERRRAVRAAVDVVKGQVPLIVGAGALRTDDAVALAQDAQDAGADALLLAPVSYTPLTDEEVFYHYTAVAEATDLPLCIYNNPGTTRFTFGIPLLEQLAMVPNIAAVKMPLPSGSALAIDLLQLRASVPDDFMVGYSGDWGCVEGLLAGADTWYSVVGGTLPVQTLALAKAAMSGDTDKASQLNAAFDPLWTLFQTHGSLRVVYAIAEVLGLTTALPPRPIRPMPEEHRGQLAAILEDLDAT